MSRYRRATEAWKTWQRGKSHLLHRAMELARGEPNGSRRSSSVPSLLGDRLVDEFDAADVMKVLAPILRLAERP